MKQLSSADYHSSPGISKSGLDLVNISPLHYWERYLNPEREPEERTDAMIQGAAFHMAIGEPDLFEKTYCSMPEGMIRRGRDWEDFKEAHQGMEILPLRQWEEIMRWRDAMLSHPVFKGVMSAGVFERSFFWEDPITGAKCRCRPDFLSADGVVVDFKTTRSARRAKFERDALSLRYHVQSAFYLDGVMMAQGLSEMPGPFLFLAIEKTPPYAVACFEADAAFLDAGRQQYQQDLLLYKKCLDAGVWPGYPTQIQTLTIPKWYKPELTEGVFDGE